MTPVLGLHEGVEKVKKVEKNEQTGQRNKDYGKAQDGCNIDIHELL